MKLCTRPRSVQGKRRRHLLDPIMKPDIDRETLQDMLPFFKYTHTTSLHSHVPYCHTSIPPGKTCTVRLAPPLRLTAPPTVVSRRRLLMYTCTHYTNIYFLTLGTHAHAAQRGLQYLQMVCVTRMHFDCTYANPQGLKFSHNYSNSEKRHVFQELYISMVTVAM